MSSVASRAVRLGPTQYSLIGRRRLPVMLTSSTTASRAARTGSVSPAGEPVPRLPPTVPALRIWGDPTVRAACARAGASSATVGSVSSV